MIKSRTWQVATFVRKHRRLPADVFELEPSSGIARMLLLSACDGQQASIERADEPGRALLRLQLPSRPDP
ncbi:transposase, partial [Streptomyces sp. NPDC047009]